MKQCQKIALGIFHQLDAKDLVFCEITFTETSQ